MESCLSLDEVFDAWPYLKFLFSEIRDQTYLRETRSGDKMVPELYFMRNNKEPLGRKGRRWRAWAGENRRFTATVPGRKNMKTSKLPGGSPQARPKHGASPTPSPSRNASGNKKNSRLVREKFSVSEKNHTSDHSALLIVIALHMLLSTFFLGGV